MKSSACRCDVMIVLMAGACMALPSFARAQPMAVLDIPAQPLGQALARLAEGERIQLLFDPSIAQGRRSNAVKGAYPPEEALDRLLARSGLELVRVETRTFLIRSRAASPAPGAPLSPRHPVAREPDVRNAGDLPLADIIVTAARYRQELTKVSASVQIVPGLTVATRALTAIDQILDGIPGVSTSSQPGGYSINMRGLGADMPSGTTQGSVALEFDGIYSIIALGTATGFLDVDRVEIVKGPQSTRYGPNAEGGMVNVISRAPLLDDASGSATLAVGSAAMVRGEMAQTVPLGQHAALRLAASAQRRDSWFHPALSNLRNQSFRARLLIQPDDRLAFRLSYQIDHIGGTGTGSESGFPVLIDKVAPYAGDDINRKGDPWAQGDRASTGYDPAISRASLVQQSIASAVSVALGGWGRLDLTAAHLAIGGSQTSCVRPAAPWSVSGEGSCYGVHSYDPLRQTSTEVRVHSAEGAPLQWTIGHYFWQFGKTSWADAQQVVPGPDGAARTGTRTQAVFAEATLPVASRLRLIAGGRQSWDHRLLRPASVSTTYTSNFSHADVRLGEEFDLAEGIMQYLTLASGYRPGGLAYAGATATAQPFASETTMALETGLKGRVADGRVQLNLSAFSYWQRHYQDMESYNGFTVALAGGGSYVCGAGAGQPSACALPGFNIASAHNIGLEWQARLQPTARDTFNVSGTLTRARFGSHLGTCATVAAPTTPGCWVGYNDQITGALRFFRLDGAVQPHSPTFATTISYEHVLLNRPALQLSVGGDAFHSSSYWVNPIEDADFLGFQPGYWQAGLSARMTLPGQGLVVSAWLRNLTNYAVKMSTLPAVTIGEPRTFGLSARLAW